MLQVQIMQNEIDAANYKIDVLQGVVQHMRDIIAMAAMDIREQVETLVASQDAGLPIQQLHNLTELAVAFELFLDLEDYQMPHSAQLAEMAQHCNDLEGALSFKDLAIRTLQRKHALAQAAMQQAKQALVQHDHGYHVHMKTIAAINGLNNALND